MAFDDFLVARVVLGILDLFLSSVRSVFAFLCVVLVFVIILGAVVLLDPDSLTVAALVGTAISAGLAGVLIGTKIGRQGQQAR